MIGARGIAWDEIEEAAAEIFNVWMDGREREWAKEAWEHLARAGLTSDETVLDATRSKLRLVALGRIYHEFCGQAWDENPDMPLDAMAEHLGIDPIALGILAGIQDPKTWDGFVDEYELTDFALRQVTDGLKDSIFDCLAAAYGDEIKLYSRMWHTRSTDDPEDMEELEVAGYTPRALQYVMNRFKD